MVSEKTIKTLKYTLAIFGLLSALYIGIAEPFSGLSNEGSIGLAVFWCAIVFWISDAIPDFITAVMMLSAWVLFKAVPFSTAFSAFASSTVWLLIAAFAMAAAIGKSGLLNRFALFLMTKFPLTFKGQTLGLMLTSLIMAPMVPSTATKCAILGPLSKMISDNMGFERQSKGAAGIFLSMYIPTCTLFCAFLSASFMNYMLLGLLPEATQSELSWLSWFLYALVWMMVVLVISYIFILVFYKPQTAQSIGGDELMKRRIALGAITRNEKIVLVVLAIAFAFWVTEKLHGINSAIVTVIAMSALTITGVLGRKDFKTLIPWDLVLFIGAVACCGPVFKKTGLDAFFGEQLGPLIVPLLEQSIVLFFVVYSIFIWIVRFVITSQTAIITIFVMLLSPIAIKLGINPWIIGFVTYSTCLIWIVKYQNISYITAVAMVVGEEGCKDLIEHKQVVPMSLCYMVATVLGYIASIPLWKLTGLLP